MQVKELQLKRALRSVLLVLLLSAVGMGKMNAQSFTVGDLNYTVNNDGISVTLTGHVDGTAATGSLTIPETVTYEGTDYSVTMINNYAFKSCSGLTGSLIIPNSVTTIGMDAFKDCSGFTGSLTIGNSVTTIGTRAFNNCSGFTGSLTIGNSVNSIGQEVFANCSGFTGDLNIPNSVTSIGYQAFYYCSGFTGNLTIPNTVTIIGELAFQSCSGFNGNLTIPNSVTTIGSSAFSLCSGLTGSLTIPNSVSIIDEYVFWGCEGLTGDIIIPNSVTTIGEGAFWGCIGFTGNLTIPNSVTTIGNSAFYQCSGLTGNLSIPNSVTSIGDYAFQYCSSLDGTLTISNSISTIGNNTFYQCMGLTGNLVIPNTVTSIGDWAFAYCDSFTGDLNIPNAITSIGDRAFYWCKGLDGSLIIPNSVTSIGNYAFNRCGSFETIEVESGNSFYDSRNNCNALVNTVTNELMLGCKNTVIPNTVSSLGDYAFYECRDMGSLTIPNSVTMIGVYCFMSCNSCTEIIMLSTNPPLLSNYGFMMTSFPIYVPYESLNDYKTASNWSGYQKRIYPWLQKSIAAHGESNGWNFMASPLKANTAPTVIDNMITGIANNYDLYRFNQSAELEWENWKNNDEELNHYHFNLENGKGYLYANAEDVNLIFKGNFNEDDTKEVSLVYDANADLPGWNLVGNPFPVNAYANMSYYRMNDDGSAIEPTAVSTTTAIPACTGVMVKATATGQSVTFNKTAPETSVNQGTMQIAVAQNNTRGSAMMDKVIVSFNEGDELGKFVFNKDNAKLYIPQGNEDYAIVCTEKQGEMPLNFEATENGTYTISVNPENVEMNYLHLIDNMTGADVDLLQTPEYTFTSKTTDYASRFRLVFSSISEDANGNDAPFAFISNGNIIVNGDGILQVVDLMGRVVLSNDGHTRCVPTSGLTAGVYVLRLIEGENVRTQKIIVR